MLKKSSGYQTFKLTIHHKNRNKGPTFAKLLLCLLNPNDALTECLISAESHQRPVLTVKQVSSLGHQEGQPRIKYSADFTWQVVECV